MDWYRPSSRIGSDHVVNGDEYKTLDRGDIDETTPLYHLYCWQRPSSLEPKAKSYESIFIMAIGDEKAEVDRTSNSVKEQDGENTMAGYLPRSDEDYNVTLKTWLVVTVSCSQHCKSSRCLFYQQILSLSYGISFWIVPSLSACGAVVATQLGNPTAASWYISIYTITVTIAFMVCGANSDLFGRRWFIVGGNAIMFIGFIVAGSAKNNTAMYAGMSLIGFVSLYYPSIFSMC